MNKYVVLNGKRYVTLAKQWTPTFAKPMLVRQTLLGETDATYGPGVQRGWAGEIKAPVEAPSAEWGTITDLMAAIGTLAAVPFVDHYGEACSVHLTGPGAMRSLHNMWDAASNAFYVQVLLTRHVEAV
jgi:hypothetical protein